MATVLQQQLAAIAANSTQQLDLKAQKSRHSKSLLFEARDAASQTFETIYQLCREGFDELCQLDARFAPFGRSLFSEQSKTEDRTSMTAEENADLDRVIERFLRLLGGRLALKPAMKAAEWLVRRFRVHEYNTEATLFTFLPYHSAPVFPTLLSILPAQLPPNFRFLHPYVTSLQNPPRHAIVAAVSSHAALFTAFSHYVLDAAKAKYQSALLLGFWASVTAQAVNGMIDASRSGREAIRRQKEEDLLLKVLPVLQTALSIRGVPELYLGSCMIMTIMATKTSLSDKVLNAMMSAIVQGWSDQTVEDGITCLAVLAEEKEQLSLPRGCVALLLQHDNITHVLERIASQCRVDRLLASLSLSAIRLIVDKQDPQALQLLGTSLASPFLPEQYTTAILESALTALAEEAVSRPDNDGRHMLAESISNAATQDRVSRMLQLVAKKDAIKLSDVSSTLAIQLEGNGVHEQYDATQEQLLVEETPTEEPSTRRLSFDDLPSLPSKDFSFLDPDHQGMFDAYCAAFHKALPSKQDFRALLKLPSLQRNVCMKHPGVLTLLVRIATSDASGSVRQKAFQITRELLSQANVGESSIDLQALVPYVIVGLGDHVKAVRGSAASTCLTLLAAYDAKKLKDASIWAKSTIYGKASGRVQWLSSADAHKVLSEAIAPVLEDCMIDQNYIVHHLADVINAVKAHGNNERKELKQALRTSIYAYLASHVVASPAQDSMLQILNILSKVGKAAGTGRTHILLPYARELLKQPVQHGPLLTGIVNALTVRSHEELQFLKAVSAGELGAPASVSECGFGRIRHSWRSMKDTAQSEVAEWLTDLSIKDDLAGNVQAEAVDTLRSLSLPSAILVQLVGSLPSVAELQGQPSSAKKQRTSKASDVAKPGSVDHAKINAAMRRITLVLEVVEGSKPDQHPQLLKGLFYLLGELQHYKTLLDSELVYLQGLLITNLLSVVNGLQNVAVNDFDRSVIRADLIVDCVRTTSSTQVHQAALLLMSALAAWAPDLVLHSVMPLFTFMSSTILKQGDEYSAHVTDQTVTRIIPPLAASLKKRGRDLITGSAELLLSFTAAFEHIPLHRRAALFQHLVKTLGGSESLFAIVGMLVERYPDDTSALPFVADLMETFPVEVQLHAVKQYLDLIFDTLKPKRGLSDIILGYAEKTQEQARTATIVLLEGLATILTRDSLRKKLSKEMKKSIDVAERLRVTYSEILEKTMQLGLQSKSSGDVHDSATNVLTSLLRLMPTGDFIESSALLMQTGSDEIRQQVFWSLEQRVESARRGDVSLQKTFVDVLPNCSLFISNSQPLGTRVAAIACMDRISEKFGKTDRTAVMQAAQQIAGGAALGESDQDIRRISTLCLASMVEVLGDEVIPILPKTFDTILRYMDEALQADGSHPDASHPDASHPDASHPDASHPDASHPDADIIVAGYSFAMAVLDHIPWMLSGKYLDRLLCIAAQADADTVPQFTKLAARKVSVNELFSAVERTWPEIVRIAGEQGPGAARIQVGVLHDAVEHHTKAAISQNSQLLFMILLKAFDLPRQLSDAEAEDVTSTLELVNDTTLQAVLKLNDATFRPFFIRFGEWATTELPEKDRIGTVARSTSLYSFALTLFEHLKSLVTSYASFMLENSASLLTSLSPTAENERKLLNLVIEALSSSFAHDQDGFWQSPAHFDAIVEPLVSRLSSAGSMSAEQHIIPAITELAAAVNSSELHKNMNTMIMIYMRHESAAVRLAAVKCERALTERLHIDWLNSLPEMLPFISELQEDDDGHVERETLRWINQIEEVTGESLDSMLQ